MTQAEIRSQLPTEAQDSLILAGPMDNFLWPVKEGKFWTNRIDVLTRKENGPIMAYPIVIPKVSTKEAVPMESTEQHPYEADDALNDHLYNIARKIDKIMNREPVANHATLLGMIQVTTQRRLHEVEQQQKAANDAAMREQQALQREEMRRRQFAPN